MKKKGFTLIEMLTVIVVLSIIITITIPIVVNRIDSSRRKAYNIQIEEIKRAATAWTARIENVDSLPDTQGGSLVLNLADLKIAGILDLDIKNPLTNKSFPNDMLITITKNNEQYVIEVLEDTGSDVTEENIIVKDSPVIILNGQYLQYIELNETYVELGAIAKNSKGADLTTTITQEVMKDNKQQAYVDTSKFGTYMIYYIVVDPENGLRNVAVRTVIIRDTTVPDIIFNENTTLTVSNASSYNPLSDVTVIDNSGENITPTYTGTVESSVGSYIITYVARDSSGNTVTKKRIIKVTN